MAKTLILGNNPDAWWLSDLGDVTVREVPNFAVNRTSDILNYISALPEDLKCLAIDVDSLNADNPELALDVALGVRLMLHTLRGASLCEIILVSDLGMNALKGYGPKSMLLMTQGVSLVGSEEAAIAVDNASGLSPAEYIDGFVSLIKVEPQSKVEGRHSIANQWGADVLARVATGKGIPELLNRQLSSSAYFNYCRIVALTAEDVARIIAEDEQDTASHKIIVKDKFKYLLIDDEADKGWRKVLEMIMPYAEGEVWTEKASCFEDIDNSIRSNISDLKYDIVFLDLRMSGVDEEGIINPEDFSGMKILKEIKRINPGIQVIMLTATNKGWNVKAMLDAGADGYYMKESPEYHFPLAYSEQNALSFRDTIKRCYSRKYLKEIYRKIERIEFDLEPDLSRDIQSQLLISYDLISKAETPSEFAFAYIALEQIFEIVGSGIFKEYTDVNGNWTCEFEDYELTLDYQGLEDGFSNTGVFVEEKHVVKKTQMWVKITAIYIFLFGGKTYKLINRIKEGIKKRNNYIHPDNKTVRKNHKPVLTEKDYLNLFDTIYEFLSASK